MIESTVIGNREVPSNPASEGNVITGENAKLLHKMAYDQEEELFKAKMQDMKDHRDYISGLEAKVLALQSKLDEIEAQPIYQYSNTHNVNLWTDCNADVFSIMQESHRRVVFKLKGM